MEIRSKETLSCKIRRFSEEIFTERDRCRRKDTRDHRSWKDWKRGARKAALGLDMRVISYVPRPEGKDIPEYIEIVSWEELLQTSDYISLHVPGGEKNQGIISKKEFAMMKKSASLIQVSRGGVVDEEALAEAIRNSQIRGAAVDVFSEEPPQKDNPLLKLEQVILTPHIGSNTVECMDRIALDVAEDVHLVLSGENPKHPIKR